MLAVNYSQLELRKEFAEPAQSVAIHPTGLFLVVSFADSLSIMNILIDDVQEFRSYPLRRTREVG